MIIFTVPKSAHRQSAGACAASGHKGLVCVCILSLHDMKNDVVLDPFEN